MTETEPALFVSKRGRRLSVRSIERLFERLRACIGTRKHVTPHTARHTFVTVGSQRGAELSALADVARHRDINVTRRYLHLGGVERRRVVSLVGVVIPAELTSDAPPSCPVPPPDTDVPTAETVPVPERKKIAANPIDAQETLRNVAA